MKTVKVNHYESEARGSHTATTEWLRELVLDEILAGAKKVYKRLGDKIQHTFIDPEVTDRFERVDLYDNKIELVQNGEPKIVIERVDTNE